VEEKKVDGAAVKAEQAGKVEENGDGAKTVRVQDPDGPQEKKHKDGEGPCGLPAKCDIM
jgi:hypothetical protein